MLLLGCDVLKPIHDKNLAEAVADRLRTAIIDGLYQPGDRLIERTLARDLGVSHIPVREALMQLDDEGLVVRLPRRGARVVELDRETLHEISSIRRLLEGFVAVRVQERLDPDGERELRELTVRMREAAAERDVRALFELDMAFHQKLWELAKHRVLSELAAQLRGRINRFLLIASQSLSKTALRAHARTHVTLLDAIAGDDPHVARNAMESHIDEATSRIERWLSR